MTTRLSPKDRELLRAIGEVLHYVWDPIGVAGVPQARDEYDGYVGSIFTLLRSGASTSAISSHLEGIVVAHLGLPGRKERSDEAASVLADWRDHQAQDGA